MAKVIYTKRTDIHSLPWTKDDKDELLITNEGVLIIKTTYTTPQTKRRSSKQIYITKHGLREMVAALEEYDK